MSPEVIDEPTTLDDTTNDTIIGRYYTKFNEYESYPEGLGQKLVDGIPKERKRYAGEIQSKTASLETLDIL